MTEKRYVAVVAAVIEIQVTAEDEDTAMMKATELQGNKVVLVSSVEELMELDD